MAAVEAERGGASVIVASKEPLGYGDTRIALGIMSTGYGLGFAVMGAVFPWVVSNYSWRYAWFFLGSAALIMVLINGLLLRSDPEASGYQHCPIHQQTEPV